MLAAAGTLQSRLAGGMLRLDLDLDDYFSGVACPNTLLRQPPFPKSTRSWVNGKKEPLTQFADVSTVQRLLQNAAQNQIPRQIKRNRRKDRARGPKSSTVAAIQAFQTRSALEVTDPIEPASETRTKLLAAPVRRRPNDQSVNTDAVVSSTCHPRRRSLANARIVLDELGHAPQLQPDTAVRGAYFGTDG